MKRFVSVIIIFSLLFSLIAVAQEEDVAAGTTPDSILWGLDVAFDNLALALTSKDKKSDKALKIAEERLLATPDSLF